MVSQLVSQFASDDFVPFDAVAARAAVPASPSANTAMRLLLTGYKTSDGSMAVNTISGPITSEAQAAALAGVPSDLARAFRAGRVASQDVEMWFGCVEEPSGEKATAKATIGGSWTTGGQIIFYVDGDPLIVTVGSGDSASDVADTAAAEIDKYPGYSYTITTDGAEITFQKVQNGPRGNSSILYCDTTEAPAGLTVTLGGDVGGTVVSDVGPWALANGDTLVVAFNAGGDQTFTIQAARASKTGSGATYAAVTAGHTLTLTLVGTQYVVTFTGSESSQATFHATINGQISAKGFAEDNGGGQTRLKTNIFGSSASGSIDAGSADVLASLGLSVGAFTTGSNNVANVAAVTAAEWVTIMSAITNGTAEDDGGALRLTSTTTGGTGTARVKSASTADDEMGGDFDDSTHIGGVGGGAAVTGDENTGDGVRFAGGTGTEDVSSLLAAIESDPLWYKRIVVSSLDTTNLGRWELFADVQNGPMVGKPVALILAHVGTQSAAIAISKTQCNHEAFEALHGYDWETPAAEIAAEHAIGRVLVERNGPEGWNQSYSGTILKNAKPARDKAKRASAHSTQKAALQSGLSPLTTTAAGETMIVRAIWTRCQNSDGSNNYLGLDVAEWTVLQENREGLRNDMAYYRGVNKHVRDDFGKEPTVPLTATPSGWRQFALARRGQAMIAARVFEAMPTMRASFNRQTKRIQWEFDFFRMPLNEQSEGIVTSLA